MIASDICHHFHHARNSSPHYNWPGAIFNNQGRANKDLSAALNSRQRSLQEVIQMVPCVAAQLATPSDSHLWTTFEPIQNELSKQSSENGKGGASLLSLSNKSTARQYLFGSRLYQIAPLQTRA
ncbi:hypothetical protein NPIL_546871 [Nephila pilipes]|uniref:Uncharacterized protein n=1 Tax=Nephila pilipes TaxID=299642 RepID=A0A8X6UL60_NEPPI|nr:hypothetical protein NPIL_546871 [Nephila pilipes]